MQNFGITGYQSQPEGGNGEKKGLWPGWAQSSELALTWADSPDGVKVQVNAAQR